MSSRAHKCALCDGSHRAVCTSPDCPQGAGKGKSRDAGAYLAQFEAHYAVQRVAKAVHFERHHTGMRTNGPSTVELPTEMVEFLLTRWRQP